MSSVINFYIKKITANSEAVFGATYILGLITIALDIWIMNIPLRGEFTIWECVANGAVIMLPYLFLSQRLRWTVFLPVWLIPVFFFVNLQYFRIFWDFIPFENYFVFNNWHSRTFDAGLSMIKWHDVTLFIPAIFYTVFYIIISRKSLYTPGMKTKSIVTVITLVSFFVGEIISESRQCSENAIRELSERYSLRLAYKDIDEYKSTGPVCFCYKMVVRNIYDTLRGRTLTEDEAALVAEFWDLNHRLQTDNAADSVNTDKNLIIVIVESLNSWAADYEWQGNKAMPVLSGLIDLPGSISARNVYSQIRNGVSSDGVLIYNTGLYPSAEETVAISFNSNDFPSIAKIYADRPSVEIICEGSTSWNHYKMNKSYGYDNLVDNCNSRDYGSPVESDQKMFDTAIEVLDTLRQPFVASMTTISTHSPYVLHSIDMPRWIKDIPEISENMRNYINSVHYFDTQLGIFLERLKQQNLYDNSVIVIASDHHSIVEGTPDNNQIIFVALNTGQSKIIENAVGQVDVFPTILDIMGNESEYRGMGLSMLNPNNTKTITRQGIIIGNNDNALLDSMLMLSTQAASNMHRGNCYTSSLTH